VGSGHPFGLAFSFFFLIPFSSSNPDKDADIRTAPYFRKQFYILRLNSLLACLRKLRMDLSASRPNSPQQSNPIRPVLIEGFAFLIEMKTIRISCNPHKISQLYFLIEV
jgi:hypothetical protein